MANMDAVVTLPYDRGVDSLRASFHEKKIAYLNDPEPSYKERLRDLKLLRKMLIRNRRGIKAAINLDYGVRSNIESNLAEMASTILAINHMIKHLRQWMKPQKRQVGIGFWGGKSTLLAQPLGIVGIIVPWNFPIYLSFIPIATAIAAGNRVMVKMSENSRHLAKTLINFSPEYFAEDKLAFFDETGEVGIEFSRLPFDLLMFTGSPGTGKSVMKSAANNLTPVILELGGKNPVIVDPTYPLEKAVDRIAFAKQTNAGQVCLNVDYVFIHESQIDRFVDLIKAAVKKMVPDINSPYFTSVIDNTSMKRLENVLLDAKSKGAQVINLSDQEINHRDKKFPISLVVNPTQDMEVCQREIFGPILSVRTYSEPQQVIDYTSSHEKPLALYIFSHDKKQINSYISRIMSGGVTVNDIALHVAQDDLPFGGVGHSGMGHYHGFEGFQSFSKMRPVFYLPRLNLVSALNPPYSGFLKKIIDM